ncbi:MAG: hypothetical protein O2794_02935, partial [bacterium]|nr:hypothetical protein [bacterium]
MKKLSFLLIALFSLTGFANAATELNVVDSDGNVKTQFDVEDNIYIEGVCDAASNDITKVYIMNNQPSWSVGMEVSDVSAGIEIFEVNGNGDIIKKLIWKGPTNAGEYDVFLDVNNNRKVDNFEIECILGSGPEFAFRVGAGALPPPPPPPVE